MSDEKGSAERTLRGPVRKLVSLSVATAAAVERYRHSNEMRSKSISAALPSESETLRRLVEIGLSRWEAARAK